MVNNKIICVINDSQRSDRPIRVNTDDSTLCIGNAKVTNNMLPAILGTYKIPKVTILKTTVDDVITYCVSHDFTFSKKADKETARQQRKEAARQQREADKEAARQQREADKKVKLTRRQQFIDMADYFLSEIEKSESPDDIPSIDEISKQLSPLCSTAADVRTLNNVRAVYSKQFKKWNEIKTYGVQLDHTQDGKIAQTASNYHIWLRWYANKHNKKWAFNARTYELMFGPDVLQSHHLASIRSEAGLTFSTLNIPTFNDAVYGVAKDSSFDPVVEAVERLHSSVVWDGVKRAEYFLGNIGACVDDSKEGIYNREVTKKTLYAMITRIFQPGAKFDHHLVMQDVMKGTGKSTIFKTLLTKIGVPPQYYKSAANNVKFDKELQIKTIQSVIMNMDECGSLFKAHPALFEQYKMFLTDEQPTLRLNYDKFDTQHPAGYILVGSTNLQYFISNYDESGERRLYLVLCNGKRHQSADYWDKLMTTEYISQIWAEMLYYYDNKMIPDYNDLTPVSWDVCFENQKKCRTNAESYVTQDMLWRIIALNFTATEANHSKAVAETVNTLSRLRSGAQVSIDTYLRYELICWKEMRKEIDRTKPPVEQLAEATEKYSKKYRTRPYSIPVKLMVEMVPACDKSVNIRNTNTLTANISMFATKKDNGGNKDTRYIYEMDSQPESIIRRKIDEFGYPDDMHALFILTKLPSASSSINV